MESSGISAPKVVSFLHNMLTMKIYGSAQSLVVDAARGLDNAADDHPQAARRCAPHNQRMQQPIPSASKLASGLAADTQH